MALGDAIGEADMMIRTLALTLALGAGLGGCVAIYSAERSGVRVESTSTTCSMTTVYERVDNSPIQLKEIRLSGVELTADEVAVLAERVSHYDEPPEITRTACEGDATLTLAGLRGGVATTESFEIRGGRLVRS